MRRLFVLLGTMVLAGCTTSGAFLAGGQTIVNLNEGNYGVSATNVSGDAESEYVFGFSFSSGLMATRIAIARVGGTGMLYAEALADLWRNYENAHGPVTSRRLALANVRYDADALNLFVYSRIRIKADEEGLKNRVERLVHFILRKPRVDRRIPRRRRHHGTDRRSLDVFARNNGSFSRGLLSSQPGCRQRGRIFLEESWQQKVGRRTGGRQ